MDTVLLIHGGLWEDVGADWFWRRTGVVDGLTGHGLTVIAPDRLRRASSWSAEAAQVATVVRGLVPSATDAEVRTLAVPVGVLQATPPDPVHPRSAVDALLRLLPSGVELPGCPEPPRPEFPAYLDPFIDAVAGFATG